MRSFSLLRTNVGLTTNVKVVVDSKYGLFLESINSNSNLESTKLKKFRFNKENYFDELIPFFFKGFTTEDAYAIRNVESDSYTMTSDFSTQFDDLYFAGARNIQNNKNFSEEFEYFAPLYIFKRKLPKYFIIFRIDGPGISNLGASNFRTDFLNKFKTVKIFNLTKETALGEWLDNNFISNINYPDASLDIDFRNLEFTRWTGINFEGGGYTSKSLFLEDYLTKERTIYDLEKFFFDQYAAQKIVHPQILNLTFLFDDTPATPFSLRKWSINRYSGFYLDDLELVDAISSYNIPELKNDVQILEGNILYSASGNPFLDITTTTTSMWVEISGVFYKVETFEEETQNVLTSLSNRNSNRNVKSSFKSQSRVNSVAQEEYRTVVTTKYKIISDISLQGKESLLNNKLYYINSDNEIVKISDQSYYDLTDWDKADVHIIQIDGKFHNLVKEDGIIRLNTDYTFQFVEKSRLNYWINNKDPRFYDQVDLNITSTNPPGVFRIFRLNFTDIKDFDTQIVDNEYSRYEYETSSLVDTTGEPRLLVTDFRANTNPAIFEQFKIKQITPSLVSTEGGNTISVRSSQNQSSFQILNIASSSDYTANLETFRLDRNNLTSLWSKNPVHSRFGYQKSLSKSNVPYLLNNNSIHEPFNRTPDLFETRPSRNLRNLDYFFSLNSGSVNFTHHSLHIEKNDFYTYSVGTNSVTTQFLQDSTFRFELDKYLNQYTYTSNSQSLTYSFDYFSYFFEIPNYLKFGQIKQNVRRYSYFENSDGTIANISVFNGMKFYLHEVDSIVTNNDSAIENINLRTTNKFADYKFSILLSKNLKYVDNNSTLQDVVNWGNFTHYQTESSNIAFRTSESATPSNISVGNQVYVTFKPPYTNDSGWRTVSSVGLLSGGGYGFVTSATTSQSFTYSREGLWEVNFKWKKIKEWTRLGNYSQGDVVIWEDILYNVLSDSQSFDKTEVGKEPYELPNRYSLYQDDRPFWRPGEYSSGDWCYRQGDFYYRNNNTEGVDFWEPETQYTGSNQVVLHKGRYYQNISTVLNQSKTPQQKSRVLDLSETAGKDWGEVAKPQNRKWEKVLIWQDETLYSPNQYVVYNKTLYQCVGTPDLNEIPDNSTDWIRIYSFEPESDIVYSSTNNPILRFNDDYYICESNPNFTLDHGITIYINEKWKNVLVNISINDNTSSFIQGFKRDILYSDYNSRLTAANFIKQLNTLDSKFGFIDPLSYVVIKEDGTFKKYNIDNGIQDLPYLLTVEYPDQVEVDQTNIVLAPTSENIESMAPIRTLKNGEIETPGQIDYYSGIPVAYRLATVRSYRERSNINTINASRDGLKTSNDTKVKSKSTNLIDTDTIYRHSGYYMPLVYEIELFKSSNEFDISGNYIFDDSLTLFAIMRQRIISKRSRRNNILKLRSIDGTKSIYPMLDEFGFTYLDQFIFKSNWDTEYHLECSRVSTTLEINNPQTRDRNNNILVRTIDTRQSSQNPPQSNQIS